MGIFTDMPTINLKKDKCVVTTSSTCDKKYFVRIGSIGVREFDSLPDVIWLVQFNIGSADQARALANVFNKLANKIDDN